MNIVCVYFYQTLGLQKEPGFPNEPYEYYTIFENKFFIISTLNVFINYIMKMMNMVFWGFGRSTIFV